MENEWIDIYIKELKNLHKKCKGTEVALSRYISCMLRLLNALAQMRYSQFHYYEKGILWESIKIFIDHFVQQVNKAKANDDVLKKRILIDDIEDSIEEMTNVFKNVIDSTANSDRQMFSNVSIDTSIYELSPKICMFYSIVLNELVRMFAENQTEYVFLLHPTLKNNTETKIMFRKREESGKVVIIYISESIIERFDIVSMFLFHEAFHVLTKKERLRKKRIQTFLMVLIIGMSQLLLREVKFDEDMEKNEKIKNRLIKNFFDNWKDTSNELKNKDELSREFYSGEVIQWGIKYCQERLQYINCKLEKWITEEICERKPIKDYDAFNNARKKTIQIINKIRKNLFGIVFEYKAINMVKQFLSVFREVYADIACILTLQLTPEEYDLGFSASKQFNFDVGSYQDSVQEFRCIIVADAVAEHIINGKREKWVKYRESKEKGFLKNTNSEPKKVSTSPHEDVIIDISPQMKNLFLKYACECADIFNDRLDSIQNISSFRESMQNIRCSDRTDLLKNIMLGDYEQIFPKDKLEKEI